MIRVFFSLIQTSIETRSLLSSDGLSLRLGSSSEPGRAARAQVLQTRPIYRVGQASGSSLWSQARARLELRIWRLDPSLLLSLSYVRMMWY